MIAVNAEDRESDVVIWIFVIDRKKAVMILIPSVNGDEKMRQSLSFAVCPNECRNSLEAVLNAYTHIRHDL